ncbi:MAG TPA: caspase family protein, partial [Polyangiales bacterium]|nr:caspase family protein [Polyangiales bacterium]
GCVNDVTNLSALLMKYRDFADEEIRVLTDANATQRAIEERLVWLAADAAPGDYLVFHFSGHGSAVLDRNTDENDGLDEILCPHDMDWSGTFITDDRLKELLQVPDGVQIEAILDCCHSGSEGDALPLDVAVQAAPNQQPRFLAPPAGRARPSSKVRSRMLRARSAGSAPVIWAGCGAKQTSADALIEGVAWGAFSQALCGLMRRHGGEVSRRRMLDLTRSALTAGGYAQRPELEASDAFADALVFSGVKT